MSKGTLFVILGSVITFFSLISLSSLRNNCDEGVVTWTGLIGNLQRLNNAAEQQLCLQQSLGSPAAFFVIVGAVILLLGIISLRNAKSAGRISLQSEGLQEHLARDKSRRELECSQCKAPLSPRDLFCSHCGSKTK
jgi:hypothetical protein